MKKNQTVRGVLAGALSLGLIAGATTVPALTATAAETPGTFYVWNGEADTPTLLEKGEGTYDADDQLVISASDTDPLAEITADGAFTEVYRFVAPVPADGQALGGKSTWSSFEQTEAAGPNGGLLADNFTLEDHGGRALSTVIANGGEYAIGVAFTNDSGATVVDSAYRVVNIQAGTGKFSLGGAIEAPVIAGAKPTISGTARVGSTLTARATGWTPTGVKLSYQWLRGGKAISGSAAKKASYKLVAADAKKRISVRVTGTLTGAANVVQTSAAKTVANGKISAKSVKVTGTAKSGKTLRAKTSSWSPKGVKLSYQWLRNGKAIKGSAAKKSSYKVKKADRKKKISVRVTGKLTGYTTVTKKSSAKTVR
ncbi:hypothetical protein J4H92_12855 [Leucobacter weissii]|uniref:Uncharacterized protein n=1 Tax=Leucobacter weissii TaxID=1983706 RepID=A0A939MMZ3_9MICO|nr:hypothetical protein [Leucobacter weissii]MBO1902835.1 hypothetical protein [Leucobacter weissii]